MMRYKTHGGTYRNVDMTCTVMHNFVRSVNHIYFPEYKKKQYEPLRKQLGVVSLRDYLINALELRRCIIVLRDEITLVIWTNKLVYVVDYETLEILNITLR